MLNSRWVNFFFALARVNASMAKDPSTKVGAVIVRPDRTVASQGWNGPPKDFDESGFDYTNREMKYRCSVHAEMNAILHAREPLAGYALFCTHPCCDICMAHIAQVGIKKVYQIEPNADFAERWAPMILNAKMTAQRCGVVIITHRNPA